jgi:hypothetical protein
MSKPARLTAKQGERFSAGGHRSCGLRISRFGLRISSFGFYAESQRRFYFALNLYDFPFGVGLEVNMKTLFTASPVCLRTHLGLMFFTLLGVHAARAQDSFTRILSGPVVSGINSTVFAWGDFNNDGFQDLFVSTRTGPSLLYSNNGNGTFSQILAGPVAMDSGSCFGATWGDYDNDGFLDLFVGVNNFGNDWLYHNNGRGGFTKITNGAIVSSGANANNCGWADYDNDGFLDLFVANSDQNDFLYHNNGDGTFTRVTNNAIALKTGNSQGGSWADYDNDGLPDLFVSRVNEPNLLYHNEGHGMFTTVTNGIIVHDVSVGQGTSWGDYDNDGYLDLFVVNPNARNFLYRNNGDGTFSKITNGAIVTDIGNGHGCGWADYDNDGYLDLFVANRLGPNFLYHNNGDGTFTRVTNGVVPTDAADAVSGAWADYDNDGFPDLFVTELNSFANRLYRNNGNSNNWLTVQCSGRLSNRAAIGAKVRAKATIGGKTLWQLREISGGGGLGSQNDLRAGFGLGDATNVDLIRIEWPSGIVQDFHDVLSRQFLTVIEPEAHIVPASQEVQAGMTVAFTVITTLPPPVNFQWQLNDVELSGETNTVLVITNTQTQHAGMYTVTVTKPDTGLRFTPPGARLTGLVVITQQPRSLNVRPGSDALFSVVASGISPLTCQWRWNGSNLPNETNTTLLITNAQLNDGGPYDVVVTNSYGSVTSTPVALGILINPVITVQPLSQSSVVGGAVTLSVAVTGSPAPFTFEWRRGSVGFWTNVTSEPVSFMTLTNLQTNQAGNYRVVIKNAANSQPGIISSNALLTVLADSDGDGLPDEWEVAHGLDPANAADGTFDDDSDGVTARDEYRSGTDPDDPQSYLRMESLTRQGTNAWNVRFWTVSNRTYSVESRVNLASGTWHRMADVPAAATNRLVEILLPVEDGLSSEILRLVCPRQP